MYPYQYVINTIKYMYACLSDKNHGIDICKKLPILILPNSKSRIFFLFTGQYLVHT